MSTRAVSLALSLLAATKVAAAGGNSDRGSAGRRGVSDRLDLLSLSPSSMCFLRVRVRVMMSGCGGLNNDVTGMRSTRGGLAEKGVRERGSLRRTHNGRGGVSHRNSLSAAQLKRTAPCEAGASPVLVFLGLPCCCFEVRG
jgi:hypothetical protein